MKDYSTPVYIQHSCKSHQLGQAGLCWGNKVAPASQWLHTANIYFSLMFRVHFRRSAQPPLLGTLVDSGMSSRGCNTRKAWLSLCPWQRQRADEYTRALHSLSLEITLVSLVRISLARTCHVAPASSDSKSCWQSIWWAQLSASQILMWCTKLNTEFF